DAHGPDLKHRTALSSISDSITVAAENLANGFRERDELGIAAKRESAARLEGNRQLLVRAAELRPAERGDLRNHPLGLQQKILVADLERPWTELRAFEPRLLDVLLPHRQRLGQRPPPARRQNAEAVIADYGQRRGHRLAGRGA